MDVDEDLKKDILAKISEYCKKVHKPKRFIPGESRIPYAGRVFDEHEMTLMADSLLDFWLTLGDYGERFEKGFSEVSGLANVSVVNSGSSANLLAVTALKAPSSSYDIQDGDEAITPASTFPTTFNPIIQNGMKPVVVDIELGTYNMNAELLEDAVSDRTKMIVVPHILGNPADMVAIMKVAKDNGLAVIEDCCDALGSKCGGNLVGTFGDIATYSFYPAHHMTMGEGGACATDDKELAKTIMSLRDWGRDCYCGPKSPPEGECKNRFGHMVDGVPYDHRYVYSNIGYNLKPLDLQCAMGLSQLEKLPEFEKARRRNFKELYRGLSVHSDKLILPEATKGCDPCWFAFPITVDSDKFSRADITGHLEGDGIMTRALFTGNILRHPGYRHVEARKASDLGNTDRVMRDSFFIGVYPGITEQMIEHILASFDRFFKNY